MEQEREAQQRELQALKERTAAATARRKAEEAEHAQANKAAILAKYAGSSDGWEESASEGAQSEVEDWELWGDPREVRSEQHPQSRVFLTRILSAIQLPSQPPIPQIQTTGHNRNDPDKTRPV